MLDQVLESIKPRLAALAEAWLSGGAAAYGLWEDGCPLAQWQDGDTASLASSSCVASPVRAGEGPALELRLVGFPGAVALPRLHSEADLIGHLIQLEAEMDAMTVRLIETQDQLLALYDLTHASRAHLSIQAALDSLAQDASRLVKADAALVLLALPESEPLLAQHPVPMLGLDQALALYRRVQREKQPLSVRVEISSLPAVPSGPLALPGRRALLAIPIVIRDQVDAFLGFIKSSDGPFESPIIKLARTIAAQGGARLENALLLQDTVMQARVQTEMELAQRVQLRLLPSQLPRVRGLDIASYSRPAYQVGGDFFDWIPGPEGRATFAVGDVSGKGMPAALMMSMIHTALRAIVRLGPSLTPAAIMAQANAHLYDDLTEVGAFITLFVGQYDEATRRLDFANAGHSPVIYCPAGAPAHLLQADGPGIGVLRSCLCQDHALYLRPGDLLVAATDGFNEAHSEAGEMLGHDHLLRLVEAQAGRDGAARESLQALVAAVDHFSAGHPQDDDQTALLLKGVPA